MESAQSSESNTSQITKIQQKIQERKIYLQSFFIEKPEILTHIKYVSKSIYTGIDLQYNQLTNIEFLGTQLYFNLTCLELDHNNLKNLESLTMLNAPNLQMLRLQKNEIQNIEPLTRCAFPNLKGIRLYSNNIANIMPLLKMSFLNSIQTFWIQKNKIYDLSVFKFVKLPKAEQIILGSNEISTTCFMKFLIVKPTLNNNKLIR